MAGPTDLPIQPAVGLEKALVAERTVEENLTVRPDFCRSDHAGQDISELVVKTAGNERGQRPVERHAASQQQDGNPPGRNQHDPGR